MTHVLEPILDRAYEAILSGSFEDLGSIYAELETFSEKVTPSKQEAARLRAKAARNAKGLESALNGVRSAKRRIAEIARVTDLSTYDSLGRISPILIQFAKLSRKF